VLFTNCVCVQHKLLHAHQTLRCTKEAVFLVGVRECVCVQLTILHAHQTLKKSYFCCTVSKEAEALIVQHQPHVVVYGHTHKPCCWHQGSVLFINPGSAGETEVQLSDCIGS
jgi:predicted phosphodiesterase